MTRDRDLVINVDYDAHPLINSAWVKERDAARLNTLVRKDEFSRIRRYIDWMASNNLTWVTASLADYRDHLAEQGLSLRSVGSILPTIRSSYRRALTDNAVCDNLRLICRGRLMSEGEDPSPANIQALYGKLRETIKNNISAENSSVSELTVSDKADDEHTWLSAHQVKVMLGMPNTDKLIGKRDRVILSLLVGMGLRESEVGNLTLADFDKSFGGEPAIQISSGKGRKKRLVPYGGQRWIWKLVKDWLKASGLDKEEPDAIMLRGLYPGGKSLRENKMSNRTIQKIMKKYIPPGVDRLTPHDLRRTYARLLYRSGMDIERISQNMGHASIETTRGYIGTLSVAERSPGKLFDMPE